MMAACSFHSIDLLLSQSLHSILGMILVPKNTDVSYYNSHVFGTKIMPSIECSIVIIDQYYDINLLKLKLKLTWIAINIIGYNISIHAKTSVPLALPSIAFQADFCQNHSLHLPRICHKVIAPQAFSFQY